VVFHFFKLKNISYLVLRYLNTGGLPFEEFSKEWLLDGEVCYTYISKTDSGGGLLFWQLLKKVKRLSLRIRRGQRENLDTQLYLIQ